MKTIAEVLDENPGVTEFVDAKGDRWLLDGQELTRMTVPKKNIIGPHSLDYLGISGLRPVRKKRVNISRVALISKDGKTIGLEGTDQYERMLGKKENRLIEMRGEYEIPDDEPEENKSPIGRNVCVYNRYLFALPVYGRVIGVSQKDGAYQVEFFDNNPGGSNVTKHSGGYFFQQECVLEDK